MIGGASKDSTTETKKSVVCELIIQGPPRVRKKDETNL